MVRLHWNIYTWDGATWVADGYIPNPGNREVPVQISSTIKQIGLADGSVAFVKPQNKYTKSSLRFEITEASATYEIAQKISAYIQNHTKIKMVTHTDEEFSGYFSTNSRIYKLSGHNQRYGIECEFLVE